MAHPPRGNLRTFLYPRLEGGM